MDMLLSCLSSFFSAKNPVLQLDVRLGVRDEGDNEDDWKHLASSVEDRNLQCTLVMNSVFPNDKEENLLI